jgi:aminoglycoside phosphotransferase family enzyme
MEFVKEAAAEEVQARVAFYLQQTKEREGDLLRVREQYAAVQALYKARVDSLKLKIAQVTRKAKAVEGRRLMELEVKGC